MAKKALQPPAKDRPKEEPSSPSEPQQPPAKTVAAEFAPESPQVGDIVLYYHRGVISNSPMPAIVVFNENGYLCLSVFTPNGQLNVDGVRHKDDPTSKPADKLRSGCWVEKTKKKN